MRPRIPTLALLAVLAIPPSAAFADGETPATTDAAPATTAAPATPSDPVPAAPVGPPASTTTVPAPIPTTTTPVPIPERSPKGPSSAPSVTGSTPHGKKRRGKDAPKRKKAKRAKKRATSGGRSADDVRDDAKDAKDAKDAADAKKTAAELLDAPATKLSALSVARFRIPPFLLPIYQAAGVQYGIRWEVLAAINEIETDYGRNLSVSTAGAQGWMQFMPATWKTYGVDANGDRKADPYNPVDAIFAAARYLKAAGGDKDVERAVFAYNHAGWYVDDVMARAKAIAGLPTDVVASLTGLTLAQLPVHVAGSGTGVTKSGKHRDGLVLRENGPDRWARIASPEGSDVVAIQDATVTRIGNGPKLGRFIELRDAYGNRYKYAHLGSLAEQHLIARPAKKGAATTTDEDGPAATGAAAKGDAQAPGTTGADPTPKAPATAGSRPRLRATHARRTSGRTATTRASAAGQDGPTAAPVAAGGSVAAVGPARPRTVADAGGPASGRDGVGRGDDAGLRGTAGAVSAPGPATVAAPPATTTVPVPPATTATAPPADPAPPVALTPPPADPAPRDPATATPAVNPETGLPTTPMPATGTPATVAAVPGDGTAPSDGSATGGEAGPLTAGPTAPFQAPAVPVFVPGASGVGAVLPQLPGTGDPVMTPGLATIGTRTVVGPYATAQLLRGRTETTPEPAPAAVPKRTAPTVAAAPGSAKDDHVDDVDRWMVRAGSLRRKDVRLRPLVRGSRVLAGSILGKTSSTSLRLAIRPAGDGTPRIDPKPIIAGWRLLDDASVFGHDDRSELVADRGDRPDVGRLLLMSKAQLQARVLADPRLTIYDGGREDVRTGAIDRRVLAMLEYLTANGLHLTVSCLKTGHSLMTASGNVSAHSYGSAVDISAVNGIPIMGHQGAGSITASTVRKLLQLQGTMKPNQIITLMTFPGADNTLAMADHDDHIHVGYPREATDGDAKLGKQVNAVLKPGQWSLLTNRLAQIDNPSVRRTVSDAATSAKDQQER
ncbi:lytic murein transglycosylase [Patulibacter minatonensis]|uniref:lytic murein transglycosylase n=1 Tax=Patulibacter minatonensis TaxID=298163 RepID=UPI0004AF9D05|nr:lytic murein transglycosylase [Patulibacter minatonensis]